MEQKAVAILWHCRHLEINGIYLGPIVPGWINEDLAEDSGGEVLHQLISTPDEDIEKMMG